MLRDHRRQLPYGKAQDQFGLGGFEGAAYGICDLGWEVLLRIRGTEVWAGPPAGRRQIAIPSIREIR